MELQYRGNPGSVGVGVGEIKCLEVLHKGVWNGYTFGFRRGFGREKRGKGAVKEWLRQKSADGGINFYLRGRL